MKTTYGTAILRAFEYLLASYPNVFALGQGLWSPWYVGNSMTGLDQRFGADRVLDTPTSELACTGAALGAALCGYRPIVVHPRIDFMLLAVDQIVTQAAKWCFMFGGQVQVPLTIRGIVNRGGEQGAQHSQMLSAWFAHIPGLRVVTPATPEDARDLLVASVLCDDPVLYIDDRWLYGLEAELGPPAEPDLRLEGPRVVRSGSHATLVGSGYSTFLCLQAAERLSGRGWEIEVVDMRVINPLDTAVVARSVRKTGKLLVVDGDWKSCGLAGEIIARVSETMEPGEWRARPKRVTLPDAPAPTSAALEKLYYPTAETVIEAVMDLVEPGRGP